MEDRIFGAKVSTYGGNTLTQSDMENTYLEQDVIYDVSYPVSGIELLRLGAWESNAVTSITQKLSTQGCIPTYISLIPSSSILSVQFKFIGAYTKPIWEAITFLVTFGVTPLITLSKPDTIRIVSFASMGELPSMMLVGGAILVIGIMVLPSILNTNRKHTYHTKHY